MNKMLLGAVFGAFLFPMTATAETLSEALLKCSKEQNSLKRLVCFDSVTKDVKQYEDGERPAFTIPSFGNEPVARREPAAPRSNAGQARTTPAPNQPESDISDLGLPKVVKRDIKKGEKVYVTVAEAKRDPRKKWILTFENGQEWRQTDTVSIKVEAGDVMYIERGIFGSFFASSDDIKKRIRVKRKQ